MKPTSYGALVAGLSHVLLSKHKTGIKYCRYLCLLTSGICLPCEYHKMQNTGKLSFTVRS